jgi:VWFA-related protein
MRIVRPNLVPTLTVALLLPCCAALRAQCAPEPGGPPPKSSAPEQAPQLHDTQTLKVNVNLVNVYFSVRDKSGFLTGLKKDECTIYEDKDPQTLKQFTQEKNLPLTIGILLDTSGSQTNVLPLEQDSGSRFLKEVLTPKDEAFLISFDVNVDLLADYTNNAGELKRAINKATINAGSSSAGIPGIGGGPVPISNPRGTLLFDAVALASNEKLRREAGRKVLILLTDGGDQGSTETVKSAVEAAQKANAIIYVILIADQGFGGFGNITFGSPVGDMEKLAGDTGGRVINVGNDGRKLEQAFDQIQDELRTQYLVSYTPKNTEADGKFRKLDYDCGKGRKIEARKGYYAIAGDADTQ